MKRDGSLVMERWPAGCNIAIAPKVLEIQAAIGATACYEACKLARPRACFRMV